MYSDDPGTAGKEEEALTDEIIQFRKKHSDEVFGLIQTEEDKYLLFTKSGKYNGELSLGKERYLRIKEV